MKKYIFVVSLVVLVLWLLTYFMFSSSYQKSIEAKYYYEFGDYKQSLELSTEAFSEDNFNKMAFSLMAQSKIALEYKEFIDNANSSYEEIRAIADKGAISEKDKLRIKIMCEIIIGQYEALVPTKLTNKELLVESKEIYTKIKELYNFAYK